MREYRAKRPLERLHRIDPHHYWCYPNLLRDESGTILSDNIVYFKQEATDSYSIIKEFEREVKKCNSSIELAFHYISGNQWIFLISSGTIDCKNLDQLQNTYDKLVSLTN